MNDPVKPSSWSRARKMLKSISLVFSGLVVLTSLILFWQDQQPIVTYRLDQTTKSLSVTSQSLIPVSFSVYAIEYDLNESDGVFAKEPVNSFYDRGFVQNNTILWPFINREINLNTDQSLKFSAWNASSGLGIEQIYYCLVIRAKSYLSNLSASYTDFTSQYDFPLSEFGQNPTNSSAGGGYDSEQFVMDLQAKLVTSCDYEAGQYD